MTRSMLVWLLPAALVACTDKADDSAADDSAADDSAADDSAADDSATEHLEIAGTYNDNWGSAHTITDASWNIDTAVFHISQFDNAGDWLVAQNDAANTYNPSLWSRFDWTQKDSELYYCQSAYDAADEAAALAASPADPSNLDAGCGGFSWSQLLAP